MYGYLPSGVRNGSLLESMVSDLKAKHSQHICQSRYYGKQLFALSRKLRRKLDVK